MNKKINCAVLIDDNDIDNFVNKKVMLMNEFAEVILDFNSAAAAIEYVNGLNVQGSQNIPDIIFLDLNMPAINGLTFLKQNEKKLLEINPKVKTVFLTSSIDPDDKYISMQFKSYLCFLSKPLNKENLKGIQELLNK